jgi:hypothetical protein
MAIKLPPTLCETGNGFFPRITCWLQSKVAWLCEKDEPDLSSEQRFELSIQYQSMPVCDGVFRLDHALCFQSAKYQREELAEYMSLCPQLVISEWVHATLAPVIPFRAKIAVWFWRKFTYGTDCHCCWSYRVIALSVISFMAGALL